MRVLSPVGVRREFREKKIDSTVAGRAIGLLDNGFGNDIAGTFFTRLRELLAADAAVSEVGLWRKPVFTRPSPDALLDELAAASHHAVVGLCA